jgi:hypothetical protein
VTVASTLCCNKVQLQLLPLHQPVHSISTASYLLLSSLDITIHLLLQSPAAVVAAG